MSKKNFKLFFKKPSFFVKKNFFQTKVFFPKKFFSTKKRFSSQKFFFFLSNDSLLSNKNFFEKKTFSNKQVLLWLKCWYFPSFSSDVCQEKSSEYTAQEREWLEEKAEQWLAGKGLLRERHLCTIFKLNKNSFCQQRAGLQVLIKVTSKADRWKQRGKSFTKTWFLIAIFSITKIVFHYLLAKFFLPNTDACDLQPAVSNFAAHGHELLVQYWHTQQAVWRFMVILSLPLPNNIQYKLFQELRTYLSADSYLWSLHLVVNIVKAMC